MEGIWELKIRHVMVGTPQKRKIDFKESYSPTVDPTTLRVHICLACGSNHVCAVVDVKNAFQNTIGKPEDRVYANVPPSYLEWAEKHLQMTFPRDTKHCVQMFNSNQGTKDAGNRWYTLASEVLKKFGFIRSHVDHAYFSKCIDTNRYMYVSLATDDLFVTCPSYDIFDDFVAYLRQYFALTIQTGPVLRFLGLRLIQSKHAISIDQGEYVFDLLCHYFGKEVDHVKCIKSPMRYDNDYEKELADAYPLNESGLKEATITYKGSYRFWTGKLIYLNTNTRPEISYCNQRLSEYNAAPTLIAFMSIVRILRYLAGDVLRPVIYPRQQFDGTTTVSWYTTPENKFNVTVPNMPCVFADAELGRCLDTRKSYTCVVITIFNVYVLIKIKKSTTVMRHTTDSEMTATYNGINILIPIRKLFEFSGVPLNQPSTTFTDNAAVHAVIDSERITTRC